MLDTPFARPRRRAALTFALLACVAAGSAACAPEPVPAVTDTPAPALGLPAPPPAELKLDPDGTASDNLPLFARTVDEVWGSDRRGEGRAYVDALVAAGFDRATMQVTRDESTVGNPAESILFSVRWGDECLVGQVGPETGEPVASVQPALGAHGVCLIGNTRPIDW